MEGAKFFHPLGAYPEVHPLRPVRVIFLTSLRNSIYGEFNGQTVYVKNHPYYMQGVIERTVYETKLFGLLHGLAEVVGVVFDDTTDDLVKARAQAGPILYEHQSGRMETLHIPIAERLTSKNRVAQTE